MTDVLLTIEIADCPGVLGEEEIIKGPLLVERYRNNFPVLVLCGIIISPVLLNEARESEQVVRTAGKEFAAPRFVNLKVEPIIPLRKHGTFLGWRLAKVFGRTRHTENTRRIAGSRP